MGQDLLKQMVYDSLARAVGFPPLFVLLLLHFLFLSSFDFFSPPFRSISLLFSAENTHFPSLGLYHSHAWRITREMVETRSKDEREHLLAEKLTIPESKFQVCHLSLQHLYVFIDYRKGFVLFFFIDVVSRGKKGMNIFTYRNVASGVKFNFHDINYWKYFLNGVL